MKKLLVLALIIALGTVTACSGNKKTETETKTETSTETETESDNTQETNTDTATEEPSVEDDLMSFANSIAEEFSNTYGFDAKGEYSDSDGMVITITAEGSSEWLDHAWDEMIDSINESYNTSVSTLERAGTGDTNLTYLVCDTDGVSYLRYVNGEVEDLAGGDRQSTQD